MFIRNLKRGTWVITQRSQRPIGMQKYFNSLILYLRAVSHTKPCGPTRAMASSFFRFLDQTQRCITVGRTLLDEWSVRRRDLYLTTLTTYMHAPGGIRKRNPSKQAAVEPCPRPCGHSVIPYLLQIILYCGRGTWMFTLRREGASSEKFTKPWYRTYLFVCISHHRHWHILFSYVFLLPISPPNCKNK
jgi:hypothetical protein